MEELYIEPIFQRQRNERGRFVPGLIPWNKGIKGFKSNSPTKFKPGHTPKNKLGDNAITTRHHTRDNYYMKFVRVGGKWIPLHRHLWELIHGDIPPGHIVIFIDGDTMNCHIDNLRCISMADNMRRNFNPTKISKSLKETWRADKLRDKYGLPLQSKFLTRKRKPINGR